jgi:hypothetical protein
VHADGDARNTLESSAYPADELQAGAAWAAKQQREQQHHRMAPNPGALGTNRKMQATARFC